MSITKNKYSVQVAERLGERLYLSNRDIENGLDVELDMNGYTIEVL